MTPRALLETGHRQLARALQCVWLSSVGLVATFCTPMGAPLP